MLTLRGHSQPRRCDCSKGITPTSTRLELTPHAQSRTALTLHLASVLSRAPDNGGRSEQWKRAKQPLLSAACAAPHAARVVLATPLGWDSLHFDSDTTWNPGRDCQGRKGQAYFKAFRVRVIYSDMEIRSWKPRKAHLKNPSNTRHTARLTRVSFQSPYTNLAQTNHVCTALICCHTSV